VGSINVPALGKPRSKLSAKAQTQADFIVRTCLTLPPGSSILLGTVDGRSAAQAKEAESHPVSTSGYPLGKVASGVPGFGSWGPSLAWIVRLRKYAENVIIAYGYTDSNSNSIPDIKPLVSLDGISLQSVAPSAVGHVYRFGEPDHRAFLTNEQFSDLVIAYIGKMANAKATLGFDVLDSHATLIGHSQGSFVVTQVKKRLIDAGLSNAVGKVITLGGGLGQIDPKLNGQMGTSAVFGIMDQLNTLVGEPNQDITDYLLFINKVRRGQWDASQYRPLVDLGVGSTVGSGRQPFVRPQFKLSAIGVNALDMIQKPQQLLKGLLGTDNATDGIMPITITLAGKKTLRLAVPADHASQIEIYRFVDDIAKAL